MDDDLYEWVRTAHVECKKGESERCFELGRFYLSGGGGVEANAEFAQRYLEIGCKAGSAKSCLVLSVLSANEGNQEDAGMFFTLAQQTLFKKCEEKDSKSCLLYALNVFTSPATPDEFKEAAKALDHGCKLGDEDCCAQAKRFRSELSNIKE